LATKIYIRKEIMQYKSISSRYLKYYPLKMWNKIFHQNTHLWCYFLFSSSTNLLPHHDHLVALPYLFTPPPPNSMSCPTTFLPTRHPCVSPRELASSTHPRGLLQESRSWSCRPTPPIPKVAHKGAMDVPILPDLGTAMCSRADLAVTETRIGYEILANLGRRNQSWPDFGEILASPTA
jgi:hypothetical protein